MDQSLTQYFKIMTYNVCRAVEGEKFASEKEPILAWKNREPRIIKMIQDHNPDILCLQECRKFLDSDVRDMMAKMPEYHYIIYYGNPSDLSLALIIAYKNSKFYCCDSAVHWLSETTKNMF